VTVVRPAESCDLPAVVSLHLASFPESLASRLGPTWVGASYGRALASEDDLLLVGGARAVLGFVHARRATSDRRARRLPVALAAREALRADPAGIALAGARLLAHELLGRGAPAAPDAASIEYLAVAAGARGQGLGSALLAGALDWPAAASGPWVVTTTADNAAALALYRAHGFADRERWRGYDGRAYVRLHRVGQ
jgi:ribosomal protein S18 acetylase RimI-like enzyme